MMIDVRDMFYFEFYPLYTKQLMPDIRKSTDGEVDTG